MNHVFGPVPSRRLGRSLGIDPVPSKTCNWNCVYCQLGRSSPLIIERKQYFDPAEIINEVENKLNLISPTNIDWITFVGSGETMLHTGIGWMIGQLKNITQLPIAVITNGSLLYLPNIRNELLQADAVLPSLDAGDAQLYKKINRAHPQFTYQQLVEGLITFRKEYSQKIWVEIMLVKGLNDSPTNLRKIANIMQSVQPDEIHILQPTRAPAEPWVQNPEEETLLQARTILGEKAKVVGPSTATFNLYSGKSLAEAIVGIITRHPMKQEEIINTLANWTSKDIVEILEELKNSGKVKMVIRNGISFWTASSGYFPDAHHSISGKQ